MPVLIVIGALIGLIFIPKAVIGALFIFLLITGLILLLFFPPAGIIVEIVAALIYGLASLFGG